MLDDDTKEKLVLLALIRWYTKNEGKTVKIPPIAELVAIEGKRILDQLNSE